MNTSASAAISNIATMDLTHINVYAREHASTINDLLATGTITDQDIIGALEAAVIANVRTVHVPISGLRSNIPADHSGYPERLAYAIEKGALSPAEIDFIRFDDQSADEFVADYKRADLFEQLKYQLLNPKQPKVEDSCLQH